MRLPYFSFSFLLSGYQVDEVVSVDDATDVSVDVSVDETVVSADVAEAVVSGSGTGTVLVHSHSHH